jgi:NADPH:quinone reductase
MSLEVEEWRDVVPTREEYRHARDPGGLVRRSGGARTGGPADPAPGHRQAVVGMPAADVIFLDTLPRGGWGREFFQRPLPYVPGGGGAGTVLRVGGGVDPAWVGRRVTVRIPYGGYTEQAVAGLDDIMPVPDGLALDVAAALVHDGVTALSLDRLGTPGKGEWVLVTSAAGGAGSLLVQLAVGAGARVVAAASSEVKLRLARELGTSTVDAVGKSLLPNV